MCLPACTGPDPEAGAFRFDSRTILWKYLNSDHPRCQGRQSGAMALTRIRLSFFSNSRADSREWSELRAARTGYACAFCDSSFSSASKKAATEPRPRAAQIFETQNKRSKCRGVRKRPAGSCRTPRPDDPRGSCRDGGPSETRPRVKLDYSATAPRS